MFEKSLYDLIRGLRHHKGNEREYIQNSIRECRAEIKGQDLDIKATALLKLVYLEMFGHDMSWASFNVLEVMSSPKYVQKRVGYLGAVQSFRPETEVLMLATNLLKKDITSVSVPTICLPLVTVPHITTPSLALSLLPDLILRLSHSSPSVRKKTLVTLYRLALVYPDTLRSAWPKIKDLLMDQEEDTSVTAAAINIVCELGWRRPRDFLPLAPRLFHLLVEGGNNWMAIKIIKLFATLTPLEPRLIKKLLPPLTKLIRETSAMSLLYECIHGIIKGGILDSSEAFQERDEVAELCVNKLRELIAVEGDPNLKYVALLSFNSIIESHPHLVVAHQDVILACVDDADISIRLQALELGSGMISPDTLTSVVDRLMRQLRDAPALEVRTLGNGLPSQPIEPTADSDGEDPSEKLRPDRPHGEDKQKLPDEYLQAVIHHILEMCSQDTYANVLDFYWYLKTLVELAGVVPIYSSYTGPSKDISECIGAEIRNVAVRVLTIRPDAVKAAASFLSVEHRPASFLTTGVSHQGLLVHAAWIVGEYSNCLSQPHSVLESLMTPTIQEYDASIICGYLQAVPKILATIFLSDTSNWNIQRQSMTSLLLARVIHFFEQLGSHANLEVQERAVEFVELFRITREAVLACNEQSTEPPMLLVSVLPGLFQGTELKPIVRSAQRRIPLPQELDLEAPLNKNLHTLLHQSDLQYNPISEVTGTQNLYYEKTFAAPEPVTDVQGKFVSDSSYQDRGEALMERRQRIDQDPFYIGNNDITSQGATSIEDILRTNNGQDVDIDAIPIMNLDLGEEKSTNIRNQQIARAPRQKKSRAYVTEEEDVDFEMLRSSPPGLQADMIDTRNKQAIRKGLLQVDSSSLGAISLHNSQSASRSTASEELEMSKALAEVERLRMEMQRASERVQTSDIPDEGTLVKKKKRKAKKKDKQSGKAASTNESCQS